MGSASRLAGSTRQMHFAAPPTRKNPKHWPRGRGQRRKLAIAGSQREIPFRDSQESVHRHKVQKDATALNSIPLYIRYPTRHTAGSIEFGQRTTAGAGQFGAVVEFFLLIRPLIRPARGGSCEMSAARAPSHALKIFFSNRFCYAQIVNMEGRVVASASSRPRPTSAQPGDPAAASSAATSTSDKVAAAGVGSEVAKKALEKGVDVVRWARGRQRYHGKVAALITAMQGDGVALR